MDDPTPANAIKTKKTNLFTVVNYKSKAISRNNTKSRIVPLKIKCLTFILSPIFPNLL